MCFLQISLKSFRLNDYASAYIRGRYVIVVCFMWICAIEMRVVAKRIGFDVCT